MFSAVSLRAAPSGDQMSCHRLSPKDISVFFFAATTTMLKRRASAFLHGQPHAMYISQARKYSKHNDENSHFAMVHERAGGVMSMKLYLWS